MSAADQITALYSSVLGRAADASGLSFYQSFLSGGGTLAQVEAMMRASPEWQAAHAADGTVQGTNPASGGTPTNGATGATASTGTPTNLGTLLRNPLVLGGLALAAFFALR